MTKSSSKTPAAALKRPTRKKPKDKPKRPLSAYNFFFKEEREKILKVVLGDEPKPPELNSDPESEDYISAEMMSRLKKEGGKVSFEEMGKLIGQRWKNIDPDRLSKYSEMAAEDTERYKKEMQSYNGRQEAKMRSEALKPPAWNSKDAALKPPAAPGNVSAADGSKSNAPAYPGAAAAMAGGTGSAFADPSAAALQMGAYGGGYGGPYGGYGGIDLAQAYAMQPMAMQAMYGGYGGYGMGGMGGMGGDMAGSGGAGGGAGMSGSRAGAPSAAQAAMYGQIMAAGGYGQQLMGYGGPDAAAFAAAAAQQGAQQGGYPTAEQMYAAQGYGGGDPSAWGGQ